MGASGNIPDFKEASLLRSSKAKIVLTGCCSPAVFIGPNVNFDIDYRLL